MNVHDSERLASQLDVMGYEKTEQMEDADIVIFNTCCVRENAENKMYGHLGILKSLKKHKPNIKVAVCGCMTQREEVLAKIKQSYNWIDIIFGTFNLHKFSDYLHTNLETGKTVIDIWKEHDEKALAEEQGIVAAAGREIRHKAGINIMYGCDNFCAYCVVPFVRGRERSRKAEDIISEAKALAADGVVEILLLGQNVNSYNHEGITFAALLEMISDIDEISRIRFITSHPKDMNNELIETMARLPKVCKSLHLPIQSGSSAVLSKMNRKYTQTDYLALIDRLRIKMPGLPITTDIIVGFPGETEEDFEQTLDVVRKVRFSGAFTFLYSKRTGTAAATMENQVPDDIASERFKRLIDTVSPIIYEDNKRLEGFASNVIADEYDSEKNIYTGRTDCNRTVHFKIADGSPVSNLGKMFSVMITEGKPFYLMGEKV